MAIVIFWEKIEMIHENHTEGEQLTYQIATSPNLFLNFLVAMYLA